MYKTLEEISKLEIDPNIMKIIRNNLGKKVFYESGHNCKVGTLEGIDQIDNNLFYIIDNQRVSTWVNLTTI